MKLKLCGGTVVNLGSLFHSNKYPFGHVFFEGEGDNVDFDLNL
jgi:hypothetical protein